MMMITCILVDDNKMARIALRQIISQFDDLKIISECETAIEAYGVLQKESVDLLFLDIEMPGVTGLELAKQIKDKKSYIVFTTGKTEYAVDAFELNVVDYLIKPITISRLMIAIEKVKELMQKNTTDHRSNEVDYFFIKDKGVLKKIKIKEILYFEAMGDYVKVHLKEKPYLVHTTLKIIEQKLDPLSFMRIHRSYIISLDKIESIEDGAVIIQKQAIPIADSYKNILNQKIKFL